MGVPKFYRWISERYPQINQIISDSSLLPEIDNFYLDMNGIIHACTHPNNSDASQSLSMREMMLSIFRYIDRMVSEIVKPKKILFMAIDGCAPRAKLNQQRARRFRSAEDRLEQMKVAQRNGVVIDESSIFDSNCITPGTEFMEQVGKHLRWFIRKKIKEDPIWRNLQVVFSGHDVPGEGEHKIMTFIRELRAQPNYEPNQRHCMYGQDADLIMLGLATHEPYFTLLREVVNFNFRGNFSARQTVLRQTKDTEFQLLHLSILREYIEVDLALNCPWKVEKERIIDDFIFLTFLVGNDFLPHLPTLDIGEHAFDTILTAYREMLNQSHGYIVENGEIVNFQRFEYICESIGKLEHDILVAREAATKAAMKKNSKRKPAFISSESFLTEEEMDEVEQEKQLLYENAILEALGKSTVTFAEKSSNDVDEASEKDFRGRYYFEKFKIILQVSSTSSSSNSTLDFGTCEQLNEIMQSYLQGLMWCLAYYVKGCVSWTWYYPYHYGPMLKDMRNLQQLSQYITFDLGQPFTPYQQLLGCLPPLSRSLLPKPYQWLMISESSPLLEYYPSEFQVDQDGKKNPWEAVVLLPFIDSKRLIEAESTHCPVSKLSKEEIKRNEFGKELFYSYDPNNVEMYLSCNPEIGLSDIIKVHSSCIERDFNIAPGLPFKASLVNGTSSAIAGFPSLGQLTITKVNTDYFKINIFGSPSKYQTIMIQLQKNEFDVNMTSLEALAQCLNRSVYVNYPSFHEAKVVAITSKYGEFRLINTPSKAIETSKDSHNNKRGSKSIAESIISSQTSSMSSINKNINSGQIVSVLKSDPNLSIIFIVYDAYLTSKWLEESEAEVLKYSKGRNLPGSAGLEIGDIDVRVRVTILQGMKMNLDTGAREKVFGVVEADVPLQLVLWKQYCVDTRFLETSQVSLETLMPIDSKVVSTHGNYRGFLGRVIGYSTTGSQSTSKKRVVDVEYDIPVPAETAFGYIISMSNADRYYSSKHVCSTCRITPAVLGQIVGSIYLEPNRTDIGFNLKKNKQYQLIGYARIRPQEENDEKNQSSSSKSVWENGDPIRVIGSTNQTTLEEDSYDIWEYSDRTIALILDFQMKYPSLFTNIGKYNVKAYTIKQLFPQASSEAIVDDILSWMKSQAFFHLQRTPLTTTALSLEAMKAIERAADVRTSLFASSFSETKEDQLRGVYKKVLVRNVPISNLFRGELFHASDIPLSFNTSNPRLGDRVVNLTSTGVPFGLRGTVIVIHASSGYVEVIFDEEFIGGKNLQGYCSQFRGRLCLWNGLLRVSTDEEWKFIQSKIHSKAKTSLSSSSSSIDESKSIVAKKMSNPQPILVKNVTNLFKSTLQQDTNKLEESKEMKAPESLGGFKIHKGLPRSIPKPNEVATQYKFQEVEEINNEDGVVANVSSIEIKLKQSDGSGLTNLIEAAGNLSLEESESQYKRNQATVKMPTYIGFNPLTHPSIGIGLSIPPNVTSLNSSHMTQKKKSNVTRIDLNPSKSNNYTNTSKPLIPGRVVLKKKLTNQVNG